MFDNLKRANAWQIAEFIQKGVEATENKEIEFPCDIEKAYIKSDDKIYHYVNDILQCNEEKFTAFLDVFNEFQQSCFILGMKAGAKLAISLELGSK